MSDTVIARRRVIQWDAPKIRRVKKAVRAVDHKLRQRIIDLVTEHGPICNTDLYIKLRLQQSFVSQHVAILRREGILVAERRGKFIYYTVDHEMVEVIQESIDKFRMV